MDSINKNQKEDNHKDLGKVESIKKMKELIEKAGSSCFFSTAGAKGKPNNSRPMSVQQVDAKGNLWFLSPSDSHKNKEIAVNPEVELHFQGSAHSDFLHVSGKATISTTKAKIKELWEPVLKTWFTEGIDDPRVTVIKFEPSTGYYWDTKHGNMVAGIKMLIGAALGKTMDDSIEGKIKISGK